MAISNILPRKTMRNRTSLQSMIERHDYDQKAEKTRDCCPSSVQDIFSGGLYQRDALTEFFDEIRRRCQFKYWFFGHYHENMVIEKKYAMLYEQIIRLKL